MNKEELKKLILKNGASVSIITDFQKYPFYDENKKYQFGHYIGKIRKIKNGFQYEHIFNSDINSNHNFVIKKKCRLKNNCFQQEI